MHRRRAEELKEPQGGMDEEDESFFVSKEKPEHTPPQKLNVSAPGVGGSASSAKRPLWGSWSGPALLVVFTLIGLTVWSLPAPTVLGKLGLLRQSWRLNAVLDESGKLKTEIAAALKEQADSETTLSREQARAMDLQRRLDSSGGETKSLRAQLAQEQGKSSVLHVSNQDLDVEIKRERDRRKELLHKLQAIKHAELKELAGLDAKDPITPVSGAYGLTGLDGSSSGLASGTSSDGSTAAFGHGFIGSGFGLGDTAASPLKSAAITSRATLH